MGVFRICLMDSWARISLRGVVAGVTSSTGKVMEGWAVEVMVLVMLVFPVLEIIRRRGGNMTRVARGNCGGLLEDMLTPAWVWRQNVRFCGGREHGTRCVFESDLVREAAS